MSRILELVCLDSLNVFLNVYVGGSSSGKTVQLIHCNEFPRTTFAVTDSYHCLVADNSLDTIFSHLKPIYAAKKLQKIEAKGLRHEVNDKYIVKVAAVTYAASSKGIIVEVS